MGGWAWLTLGDRHLLAFIEAMEVNTESLAFRTDARVKLVDGLICAVRPSCSVVGTSLPLPALLYNIRAAMFDLVR